MGLVLVTAPDALAVTLEQARAHLRVEDTDEDILITAMLKAAIGHAERYTGRAFVDQTWDLFLDGFPSDGSAIRIPKPPLIEVTGVYYRDSAGDEQEFDAASYLVDVSTEKARLQTASSVSWPTPQTRINATRIRFRAGYLDTSVSPAVAVVPEDICAAIKIILGNLYAHRESVVIGQAATELPWSAMQLLRLHRIHTGMA